MPRARAASATPDDLLAEFPDSPYAERARFLRARKGKLADASTMLRAHLHWRDTELAKAPTAKQLGKELPEWNVVPAGLRGVDGTLVVVALPALCDPTAATPAEYAFATALLLEQHLPRDSEAAITILSDVGGIAGGVNAAPGKLMSVIRELSKLLSGNYPERMRRLVIYPVPLALRGVWAAVKLFLDPVTASKAVLFGGSDPKARFSPAELGKYIDLSTMPGGELYGRADIVPAAAAMRQARAQGASSGSAVAVDAS